MKRLLVFAVAALVGLPGSAALAQQQPQEQTPMAQPGPAPTGQSGPQITSDSLVGTTVRDAHGKEIGAVSQLLIDAKEGKVTSVIIRQGGALGFGGKDVSVPWNALKVQRDQDKVVLTMQQEMLEQAPPAASPPTSPPGQQPPKQ